jgi:hypothetical protein
MSKGLLCHRSDLSLIDIKMYDYIFILDSTKREEYNQNHISISLPHYFMRAHKQSRRLNREFLKVESSSLFLSLVKSIDKSIFEVLRNLEILQDIDKAYQLSSVEVIVKNQYLFQELLAWMSYTFSFSIHYHNKKEYSLKESAIVRFFYRVFKLHKYLFNAVFFQKSTSTFKNLLVPYHSLQSYKNIKYLVDDETLVAPLISDRDDYSAYQDSFSHVEIYPFITFREFIKFPLYYVRDIRTIKEIDVDKEVKSLFYSRVVDLVFARVLYSSIISRYKVKNILGEFDTTSYIDYVTEVANEKGTKTYCIPHGINFKYKVHYISMGVNHYAFWSIKHQEQFYQNLLVDDNVEGKICGYIGFKELKDRYLKASKGEKVVKSILVIGEYFSNDNFYSSPFHEEASRRLFECLKEYAKKYHLPITIRTRLSDAYFNLAKEYEPYGFRISSPSKKDIYADIMGHDLVISVFSNALHEALLLRKKTLQVNFIGIENYRDLAHEGLVYYADNEKDLDEVIERYVKDQLEVLDFDRHERVYCNSSRVNSPLVRDSK